MAGNKFDGPWSASRVRLGPDRPAFAVGDRVRAKASPGGPAMTVESVSPLVYVSGSPLPDPAFFAIRYRRWCDNGDGPESAGSFREDELAPAPAAGRD